MRPNTFAFEVEAGNGGAIIMMMVPDEMAKEVVSWSDENIPDEAVYGKDGKGKDNSPHITLQNGILTGDVKEIDSLMGNCSPVEVEFGPISIFRREDRDYDVLKVDIVSDPLMLLNQHVKQSLEVNDPFPEYIPHMTLAYVKRGEGDKFKGMDVFDGKKVVIDKALLAGGGFQDKMYELPKGEKVPGGKSEGMDVDQIASAHGVERSVIEEQLKKGIQVELEHTEDTEVAREIALDHLAEFSDYYDRLEKMEAKASSREPLKEQLDYGFLMQAQDLEDYLLTSGRSVKDLTIEEAEKILRDLKTGQ